MNFDACEKQNVILRFYCGQKSRYLHVLQYSWSKFSHWTSFQARTAR